MKSRVLWELILKLHFKEKCIFRIQSYILYLKETVQTFCHIYIACNVSDTDAVLQWLTGPGYLKDAEYIPSSFTNGFQHAKFAQPGPRELPFQWMTSPDSSPGLALRSMQLFLATVVHKTPDHLSTLTQSHFCMSVALCAYQMLS